MDLQSAIDTIDQSSTLVSNLLDTYESLKSDALNTLVKRLTVLSIMLALVALIPSIFGISLNVSPFRNGYQGYLISLFPDGSARLGWSGWSPDGALAGSNSGPASIEHVHHRGQRQRDAPQCQPQLDPAQGGVVRPEPSDDEEEDEPHHVHRENGDVRDRPENRAGSRAAAWPKTSAEGERRRDRDRPGSAHDASGRSCRAWAAR